MIASLFDLHWREPLWLGLAAVPLLFGWWRRQGRARWLRYADAELLPWAVQAAATRRDGSLRALAHALAWLLLALAAAGPRLPLEVRAGQAVPRHALTVMVAVDVSASMRASDILPDRLGRARLELLDWLVRLRGERVGLIVYAGEAGLLLPPTDDLALLRRAIEQIDPRLIEAQGTHLAAALELARAQLATAPGVSRALLLVTDAEAGSVDAAAQAAFAAVKWPLFVLGVGSESGAPVPLPEGGFAERDGVPVQSRMDAGAYRSWAQATGGRFIAARDGDADWVALHDRGIAGLPGDPVAPGVATAWRELYAWCLAPALTLLMGVFLPRRLALGIVLGILAASAVPPAAWAGESEAWQAWQQKNYAHAQTLYAQAGGYAGQSGAGAAGWRLADYAAAARHFGAALLLAANDRQRADALYNLGNARYGQGQYRAAIEIYETVLQMRPGDAKARTNLAWALQRLRRQPTEAPMKSDLRGRRGMLAEGRIPPDSDSGWRREDTGSEPAGVQIAPPSRTAGDARAQAAPAARPPVANRPQLAASGLKKLGRLEDRPAAMLRNVLKQDARNDATERPPW